MRAWMAIATVFLIPAVSGAGPRPPVFSTTAEDGRGWLSFHLAMQLRWQYGWLEREAGAERVNDNRIHFRRIRPVIKGNHLDGDLTWLMHLNLVPGSLELLDLWLDYRLSDALSFRAGQQKIPFTRYRLASFKDRPLVEWSHPTIYFGAERQMGVTLHNRMDRPPGYEYQLGVYTGVNARASNGIGMSKIFAEPLYSPSALSDPLLSGEMHSEVVGHLAYNSDGMTPKSPTDWEGGPPRFSVGLSAAWDLRPGDREDMRLRIAPEVELRICNFALDGVFYLGWWDQVTGDDRYRLGLVGGVLQSSYLFLDEYQVALRYTLVHILPDLRRDARRFAAQRTGAAPELADPYRSVGRLEAEHEANLGFNWYLVGTTFKWQVDLGLLVHQRTDGQRTDFVARTQLQLSF